MNKICKCLTINASIGIIAIYNSIISIIDLVILVVALILLTDNNHHFLDVFVLLYLIFAIIALPCIICGICYIWSLFHIQNNLKIARFFGICNFIMMLITLLIIVSNLKKEEQLEKSGMVAVFMILNILSIISIMFLCALNCGYEDEKQREQTRITRALHNEPVMKQITYPIQYRQNEAYSYPVPETIEMDIENQHHTLYNDTLVIPSAPVLSPSLEGIPTLR